MATTFTIRNLGLPVSRRAAAATSEQAWVRWLLIGTAVVFLAVFLFMPLAVVFTSALAKGVSVYFSALREPDALAAIRLTLIAAGIAFPLSLVFGLDTDLDSVKFVF